MSVLVTGGAGFLGSHVVRELLLRGEKVVVLDDLSGGLRENVPEKAEFILGNVCDPVVVAHAMSDKNIDTVFHLAAYAAEGLSHFIRRFNYTNNVVGSVTVLNEAIRRRVSRFVFTSSIAVYGEGELPLRESHVPTPSDPYGIAKFAVEQDLRAAHEQFGIDYTILRPHNLYGPYQSMRDRYRNVVGIFFNQIMRGTPLTIFGDGAQTRAFTYVGDVARMMADAGYRDEARNRVFNIGGDRSNTVRELAETVLRVTGAASEIRHVPARNEVTHAVADHTLLHDIFGPVRESTLEDGLRITWEWAKNVGPVTTAPFHDIEVDDHLPAIWRS